MNNLIRIKIKIDNHDYHHIYAYMMNLSYHLSSNIYYSKKKEKIFKWVNISSPKRSRSIQFKKFIKKKINLKFY